MGDLSATSGELLAHDEQLQVLRARRPAGKGSGHGSTRGAAEGRGLYDGLYGLLADPAAPKLVRQLNVGQARSRERNKGCQSLRRQVQATI